LTKNLKIAFLLVFVLSISGCITLTKESETIFVGDGTPVRLRETVPNVKLWTKNSEGVEVPSVGTLHAGGYYLTDPGEEAENKDE